MVKRYILKKRHDYVYCLWQYKLLNIERVTEEKNNIWKNCGCYLKHIHYCDNLHTHYIVAPPKLQLARIQVYLLPLFISGCLIIWQRLGWRDVHWSSHCTHQIGGHWGKPVFMNLIELKQHRDCVNGYTIICKNDHRQFNPLNSSFAVFMWPTFPLYSNLIYPVFRTIHYDSALPEASSFKLSLTVMEE